MQRESKSDLAYLPLNSISSMNLQTSNNRLFQLIFSLTHNHKLKPVPTLRTIVSNIVSELKTLKSEGRFNEIISICNKNDKLKLLSKVLRPNYFKCHEKPPQQEPSTYQNEQIFTLKPPQLSKSGSCNPSPHEDLLSSIGALGSIEMSNNQTPLQHYQYYLKIQTIKLFYHLLINQKMVIYLTHLHIPLQIYIIILGEDLNKLERDKREKEKPYIIRHQVEKCLKFIYQYIKISKSNLPKIYCFLIKNLLLEYYPCPQDVLANHSPKVKRMNLCLDFIFETAILIFKKNLSLAAQCGILTTLYHKCLQGTLPLSKVELITQLIITYCIEEKHRSIIHNTIDLDKTFAIFTNVDKSEWTQEKKSPDPPQNRFSLSLIKNKDSVVACSTMIEMYLSHWPTLLHFLQQQVTLRNFIISLKRKQDKQLTIIQELIFLKIATRCLNYNRKKLIKSNNIFSIQSNYLILRPLTLLHYLDHLPEFKQLIAGNRMLKFRQAFIAVLLDYFIVQEDEFKHRSASRSLEGSIKNINYKQSSLSYQSKPEDQKINNNIQSFCSDSLLPFEFNQKELKYYLTAFIEIIHNSSEQDSPDFIDKAKMVLTQLQFSEKNHQKLIITEMLSFYQVAQESLKHIPWKANFLDISKYISNLTGYLMQFSQGQEQKLCIMDICRNYLREIFNTQQQNYFQFLNVNLLDDIGRFFPSDSSLINAIWPNINKHQYAYKISRILLHIDHTSSTNFSASPDEIYNEICKNGSKALILQVIEIIKYLFEQNDNIFRPEHLSNIFMLITSEDEDIVYSIIQFSEQYILKAKDLEAHIRAIDLKRVKQWPQRINYLFLYYQSTIRKIEQTNPTLLKEELQLWLFNNDKNRKKLYYNFLSQQLKKFALNSIEDEDYLNLNFDPNNYRKLIFLPWNIKINNCFYPIFIEYKNLQDKLKLKIFTHLQHFKQINIEQLFIGAHDYTPYIQPKSTIDNQQHHHLTLTLEEIKKEHMMMVTQTHFTLIKGDIIYFITYTGTTYVVERININISLTLDSYRPLLHPINFINLLCKTKYGCEFLKKEKFIEHCLEVIRNEEEEERYKDHLKGALVSIGTICGSHFMPARQTLQIHNLIFSKYSKTTNYQLQQIYLWILNILIKENHIRSLKSNLHQIQTKKCNWICLPNVTLLYRETYPRRQRIHNKVLHLKFLLPQKPPLAQKCLHKDELIHRFLYDKLNSHESQLTQFDIKKVNEELEKGNVSKYIVESLIKYISTVDFKPERIKTVMNLLGNYFVLKFDSHFFINKNDTQNINILQLP